MMYIYEAAQTLMALLRQWSIRVIFPDDMLIMAQSRELLNTQMGWVIQLLQLLGFVKNPAWS